MTLPKPSVPDADRRLDTVVVLGSIIGFWLFYVAIVSARAAILDFPMQGELLTRRLIVSAIGVLVTVLLWQIVRLVDRRPLGTRVAAAMTLAVPGAVGIAAVNYYFFNVYDPIDLLGEKMPKDPAGLHVIKEIAELSISRYFFLVACSSWSPGRPSTSRSPSPRMSAPASGAPLDLRKPPSRPSCARCVIR